MKAKNLLIGTIAIACLVLLTLPAIVVTLLAKFTQLMSARSAAQEPAMDFETSTEELPPFVASKILISARSAVTEPAVDFDTFHEELRPPVTAKTAAE